MQKEGQIYKGERKREKGITREEEIRREKEGGEEGEEVPRRGRSRRRASMSNKVVQCDGADSLLMPLVLLGSESRLNIP